MVFVIFIFSFLQTLGAMFMCMRDKLGAMGKSSDEDDSSLHVNVNLIE
jgi:hypothetical protein